MIIRTVTTLIEAQFLCSLLESEGITATIPEEQTPAPYAGVAGGYTVVVPDADAGKAREVLASAAVPAKEPPPRYCHPVDDSRPGTKWRAGFNLVVGVDALLLAVFLSHSTLFDPAYPTAVTEYLNSLAASLEVWSIGYLVYRAGTCLALCGSVLLLLRVRYGLHAYLIGQALAISTLWVYPGGIVYGVWSVLGAVELMLAGMIIAAAAILPLSSRSGAGPT